MSKIKFIDDEKGHNQVLYELNLIDDDDDYQLFLQKEIENSYQYQDFDIHPIIESYIIKNELYYDFSVQKYTYREDDDLLYLKGQDNQYYRIYQSDYEAIALKLSLDNQLEFSKKAIVKGKI